MLLACSSDEEDQNSETGNPTPELAVVVFATADAEPEDTEVEDVTPIPIHTATPAVDSPTVGSGFSGAIEQEPTDTVQLSNSFGSSPDNRPPDVNPLTGLKMDDPATLERRPLMVRIGNDPTARPQVALNEADIIYEEITEWWITRFTAIFLSNTPEMVAPVRSARLINLQLTPQYRGALINSGGSDEVRWLLSQGDLVNMDEYFVPKPYFYRENEGWQTRLAIDTTAARDYLVEEELESNINLRGFHFSEVPDLSAVPPEAVTDAWQVSVPYPRRTTETTWKFDPESGRYLRFIDGEPFTDSNNEQVSTSNVIIYFAEHQETDIVEDSKGATSIRIIVNGQGKAWIARDGKVAKGNWESDGKDTPLFTFDNDQPMPLKPGNTWVEIVPLNYVMDIDGVSHAISGIIEAKETQPAAKEVEAQATEEVEVEATAEVEVEATAEVEVEATAEVEAEATAEVEAEATAEVEATEEATGNEAEATTEPTLTPTEEQATATPESN